VRNLAMCSKRLPSSLWFAGGYLYPYDAQETALLSAIEVANGLNGGSAPRGDALLSSM
jgi:hypothetical protein